MTDPIQNGFGAQALDQEALYRALAGSYVAFGCTPSVGANALEVDVASGTISVNGSEVSVASQPVTLTSGDSDPRKDVIYLDASGTAQVAEGTPAPAQPNGETGRDTYQPQPVDLSGVTGVVVGEVWVPAGASDVTAGDISDRRPLVSGLAGGGDTYVEGYDATATFSESDVEVQNTQTQVVNESVKLFDPATTSRTGDSDSFSSTGKVGVEINPNVDLDGITADVSDQTSDVTTGYVLDSSTNVISSTSISSGSFTVDTSLSAESTYFVAVDAGGNSFTEGQYDYGGSWTESGTALDLTGGLNAGSADDRRALGVNNITGVVNATSGMAVIELASPSNITDWNVATFTRTLDGETVDVFVAYSNDGGSTWTRLNGGSPIDRNFSLYDEQRTVSGFDASSNVRFEVELQRDNTSNNPTFDSAVQSWRF